MKTIAIFLHHPECSRDCVSAMRNSLSEKFNIVTFTVEDIQKENFFDNIHVIAFPGGIGDSDTFFNFFNRRFSNRIEKFIQNGGHYLGICMGAYWAEHRYFDLIDQIGRAHV